MTHPMLEVKNLTRYYNGMAAVNDVSFQVPRGEIMGFLGPNGAGKTTSIRMILGILSPSAGEATFYFQGTPGPLETDYIGYLPEDRGLYDDAKVLPSLIYLGGLKGVDRATARQRSMEWLERMDLVDYANQKLEKLSKGMQQKVQFIATILHQPEMVVLDEPFSGLDPINQDLFKTLITELRDQGVTVLLSAHQMNLVQELCDRIFLINSGKAVLYGTLEEIRNQHVENAVSLSWTNDQGVKEFVTGLEEVRELEISDNRAQFKLHTDYSPDKLLSQLTGLCKLHSVSIEKPSLHEIFIDTVQGRVGK